ncbi:MAG: hypothetical protein KF852_13640 [Saprospiraceae bacterium]|nr:hypothetical protein [Saprospiraceae bacterium]
MSLFHFTLRFDDDEHSLTAQDGLPAGRVGELLVDLSQALNLKNSKSLVLSEIRGNCYALQLTTHSVSIHERLKIIHSKVSENDYRGFTAEERKYVHTLKAVLGNKLHLNAYDESKSFKVKVEEIKLPKNPDHYFENASAYGIITSIGGTSLEGKSYIKINQEDFQIEINQKQEKTLLNYYKKNRIRFSIRKKINFETDKISSAMLLDFEILEQKSFAEAAAEFRTKHPEGTSPDTEDSVTAVRRLREG